MDNNFTYIVYIHGDDIAALLLADSVYAMSNPRGSETPVEQYVSVPGNMKDYKIVQATSKLEAIRKYFLQDPPIFLSHGMGDK